MELIERIEAAGEGSRELDADIYAAIHEGWEPGGVFVGTCREVGNPGQFVSCPHYTTSIDAALTLVPDDRLWSIGKRVNATGYVVSLDNYGKSFTAATPALALCAATLLAMKERDDG